MKKFILLMTTLMLLASCGSKTSGTDQEKSIDPIVDNSELTPGELALKTKLLETGVLSQKELLQTLVNFRELKQTTMKKLDRFINVECIQSKGLCTVTSKD